MNYSVMTKWVNWVWKTKEEHILHQLMGYNLREEKWSELKGKIYGNVLTLKLRICDMDLILICI